MKKIYLIIIFCVLTVFSYSQDFEVAPVLMNFTADPGSVQTKLLTVKNYSNIEQTFSLKFSDYIIDENGSKQTKAMNSTENSCANWITISPSFVELKPNESKEINVSMAVPQNRFETRWGMIHVEVAKEKDIFSADKQLTTGVVVVPRINVLVKQSPKSNTNYSAKVISLTEITANNDDFRKFEIEIHNTGDKVIDAKVFLAVANIKTAVEKKYKETVITVYPNHKRNLTLTLPEKLETGEYAIAAIMDYGHRKPIEGTQIIITQK